MPIGKRNSWARKGPVREVMQRPPARRVARVTSQLGAPKIRRCIQELHQSRAIIFVRSECLVIETEAFRHIALLQMCKRKVPAQVATKGPVRRIIVEPRAQEPNRRIALAILVMEMRERMGGIGIVWILGDRPLDPMPGGFMMAKFRERHRVVTVEPPIVAIVRRQDRQKIELILLAANAAGGADQAGLSGSGAHNQCVARPTCNVPANRNESGVRLAIRELGKNFEMAHLPFRQAADQGPCSRDSRLGTRNVSAQLQSARPSHVRQREIGVGGDRPIKGCNCARVVGEQQIAAFDIGASRPR